MENLQQSLIDEARLLYVRPLPTIEKIEKAKENEIAPDENKYVAPAMVEQFGPPSPEICIYILRIIGSKMVYVGQSKNYESRKITHMSNLRVGKHHNKRLQEQFLLLGESSFVFSVLERVEKKFAYEREQFWMDCNKSSLLNSSETAKGGSKNHRFIGVTNDELIAEMKRRRLMP